MTIHDCVWKAPEWFKFRTSLNNIQEYEPSHSLFTRTLQVEDINIRHCLDYLLGIRIHGDSGSEEDPEKQEDFPKKKDYTNIPLLYSQLSMLIQSEKDAIGAKETIRYALSQSL